MSINNNCHYSSGITYPQGFWASGICAGIKKNKEALDLGAIISSVPAICSGVFTQNRFCAPSVSYSRKIVKENTIRGILINSGNANAGTGQEGILNVLKMGEMGEKAFGLPPQSLAIAQTGIIGVQMDMNKVQDGLRKLNIEPCNSYAFAKAIITTDTVVKEYNAEITTLDGNYRIGGVAKGSGMIHPNMATLLAFFTTDAKVQKEFLDKVIKEVTDSTFNMITVDKDTSTNDSTFIMANGLSNIEIKEGSANAIQFTDAIKEAFINLAQKIVRDGEGATKFLTVNVFGAKDIEQARTCARAIAASPLVKTAVHGQDPNWGRIIAAAGYSGAEVNVDTTSLFIGPICIFDNGTPQGQNLKEANLEMHRKDVIFNLYLNIGEADATAWGCDLSGQYVTINSEYST
ncbi:MAG: bifunctional glutamate N-acetyltransferase/amino-acid acetyltransferase ArgJ [Chloroflexi bacterium]|nr:bifunctional glutamate N-acetyltransferase/amino-acid acetyltransferase ArgJ [Chloroflexota bacterium]